MSEDPQPHPRARASRECCTGSCRRPPRNMWRGGELPGHVDRTIAHRYPTSSSRCPMSRTPSGLPPSLPRSTKRIMSHIRAIWPAACTDTQSPRERVIRSDIVADAYLLSPRAARLGGLYLFDGLRSGLGPSPVSSLPLIAARTADGWAGHQGSTGVDRVSDAVGALDAAIRERMIGRRGVGRSMVS